MLYRDLSSSSWFQDVEAKTLSWYSTTQPVVVSNNLLNELESKSSEFRVNSRVCLHTKSTSALHEMLICQRADMAHPPKKHWDRDKTFLVLRGELLVATFNEFGEILDYWILGSNLDHFCIRIPAGLYHCAFSITNTAIHLETTLGPFSRESDREYLWAGESNQNQIWKNMRDLLLLKVKKHM